MEQRISQLFDLLNTWRALPNYQLERRADIFFALYLAEIMRKPFPGNSFDLIIPEFPLRLGTIREDVDQRSSNRSVKVDYACIDTKNKLCVLLELKTDDGSTRDVQYTDMELAQSKGFASVLEGLGELRKKSRSKEKYDALFGLLEAKGLVTLSGTGRNEHAIVPSDSAKSSRTVLAIIKPIETLSAYECEYLDWYVRAHDTVGEPFDPRVCVQLARAQWSNRPELATAFARCTAQWPRREEGLYTYFIAPQDMAARWNFFGSLFLQHPEWGTLVVDVISDPVLGGLSIGGIEFLDRVMAHQDTPQEVHWHTGFVIGEYEEEADEPDAEPCPQMRIVHRGTLPTSAPYTADPDVTLP